MDSTITFYAVDADVDRYQYFLLDEEEAGLVTRELSKSQCSDSIASGQLFKIPEAAITAIYYWERSLDGPDEQFRNYCEREDLTGLLFRELYTTECRW